ncbi:MAG: hypothetical protein R3F33_08810 [Planctomycetota bacterium]
MSAPAALPNWCHLAQYPAGELPFSIAVVCGGRSSEREVSLKSGRGIAEALRKPGNRSAREVFVLEAGSDGSCIIGGEAMPPTRAVELLPAATVFLLALHGGEGEGGEWQGFLQIAGRVHTGAPVAASALCLDKVRSRHIFASAGLELAHGLSFAGQGFAEQATSLATSQATSLAARIRALGPGPWFVKASLGGSSVAMQRWHANEDLEQRLRALPELPRPEQWLVEQAVAGIEVTVPLLEDRHGGLQVLPVVEIRPQAAGWFDYHEKYADDGALELCPPQNVADSQLAALETAARRAWNAAGLSGYARLDFLVPADRPPVLLEANTLPGFTSRSLFPLSASRIGLPYRELCLELAAQAWGRTRG